MTKRDVFRSPVRSLILFSLVALLLTVTVGATRVAAHEGKDDGQGGDQGAPSAELQQVKTEPAAGEVLTRPVRNLRVFLDAPPKVDQSRLTLEGPGEGLRVEGLHTMGANDLMALVVGPMPDGEYTARWSATFEDGKTAAGSWTFTVRRETP